MTVATDITALKARCTAMEKRLTAAETKNVTQSQSILDLRARCAALEAAPPFNPADLTARLVTLAERITDLEADVAKITQFLKDNPGTDPPLDVTPPVTADNHLVVSLVTPCTVTLTPTDAGSGMVGGAAKTEYKVDGAGSYTVGTSVVMTTGAHTVAYRSTDADGNLEAPDKSFSITVTDPPPPSSGITLSASHAAIGAALTITGSGFGAAQGASTVTFGERPNAKGWCPLGRTAVVTAWSNTEITCTVPSMSPGKAGAANTYHPVYVTVAGGTMSDSVAFYMDAGTTYTAQNYTAADLNGVHDRLYTGCNFTASAANTAALLIRGSSYNLTFHNCTIGGSNYNGCSINELSNSGIRDITFADATFPYSERMNFECTSRSSTTKQYERIGLIGCTFEPSGSECVSFDGYADWPTYVLVKDTDIQGAGNSSIYTEWHHGLEFNDITYCTAQNVTIGQCRAFLLNINIGSDPGTSCHWVFEDCVFDRGDKDPQQTVTASTSGRPALIDNMNYSYWSHCTFNSGPSGTSFNNMHLEDSSNNEFHSCSWLGASPSVSLYGTCTGNTGLPT